MKVSDSRHYYDELLVQFIPDRNIKMPSDEPVMIRSAEGHSFLVTPLARHDRSFHAAVSPKDRAVLEQYLCKRTPMLAYTLPCPRKQGKEAQLRRPILVQIRFYTQERSVRSLDLNLDQDFLRKARQTINSPGLDHMDRALKAEFLMAYNGEEHIIAGFQAGGEGGLDEAEAGTLDFIIAGRGRYLKIAHRTGPDGAYYACQEILSKPDGVYQFILLHGKMEFLSETKRIASMTLACVKELKASGKSYLETWNRYGNMYSARTTRHCLEGGVLRYHHKTPWGGAWRLALDNPERLEAFEEAMTAQGSRSVAVLEEDPSTIFDQFLPLPEGPEADELLQEAGAELKRFLRNARPHRDLTACSFDVRGNKIPVEGSTDELPESGYIILDTQGEIKITERRERARDAIANATCAMPDLAMILEGVPGRQKQPRNIQGLTPEIQARIFPENPPTDMQKTAIDIALNTPDIALIQGPPGTGKTTVITAIVERLKELYDGDTADYACILVTAYQHAAVENAIERMNNYGLPVIKVGVKRGEKPDRLQQNIEAWRTDTLAFLEEKHPELKLLTEQNRILDLYQAFLQGDGSVVTTLRLLRDAEQTAGQAQLPARYRADLHQAILRLERMGDQSSRQALLRRELMNLPCNQTAYEDGGAEIIARAREMLRLYDPKLFESQIQFLDGAPDGDPQGFFSMLAKHRTVALAKLLSGRDAYLTLELRTEIAQILKQMTEAAQERLREQARGLLPALLDYRDGLSDPYLVKEAMIHYSCVSGETNQHSASAATKQLRRSDGRIGHYDTVIVDEAARSNPLDLMIPLALAKDRIILVGDHRQLPHMVDDDLVASALSKAEERGGASLREEEQAHLKDSLFQRLFLTFQELDKTSGVRRTVTLDKQYRMHPLLGKFVSDNFYARHNPGEVVHSPTEEGTYQRFEHALPGLENKACAWLRVPDSAGREEKNAGGSRVRKPEAEAIMNHLGRMLDSPAGEKLSFGIITFYSGQTEYIKDLLQRKGIAEETSESGIFRLLRGAGTDPVRLQVGTVDAFQGKEFDVVYLSIVRCNPERKYGFLTENRLCVSMSRQKKLLIVAGDPEMVLCEDARENVPALQEFYKLCEKEAGRYGAVL